MKPNPLKAEGGIDELADRAAKRASEKAARMIPPAPPEPPSREITELRERIARLENMIDNATIEAICNEDGTITVTLNWGGGGGEEPPPDPI